MKPTFGWWGGCGTPGIWPGPTATVATLTRRRWLWLQGCSGSSKMASAATTTSCTAHRGVVVGRSGVGGRCGADGHCGALRARLPGRSRRCGNLVVARCSRHARSWPQEAIGGYISDVRGTGSGLRTRRNGGSRGNVPDIMVDDVGRFTIVWSCSGQIRACHGRPPDSHGGGFRWEIVLPTR